MKKSEIDFGVSGIYQIIFDDGGRKPLVYVGESKCIKSRWERHFSSLKGGCHHNSYIQNVLNKYGWDNFEFKVLEVMDESTQNERHVREKFWIKELKTFGGAKTYDGYGFNLTDGGGGTGCGADSFTAKPCEVDGVRYSWQGEVAKVYGISSGTVYDRIQSTSLRFKYWLGIDDNGKVIPKDCFVTKFDKDEEDKYILEYKIKGEHVGWRVMIPFVDGKQKEIGNFKMDEKQLAREYRDYWLGHPNKSDFVDAKGEYLKDIFYNDNIDLLPRRDLTKGTTFIKKKNKYESNIKINKNKYSLGYYTTPQEASRMHYFTLYNYVLNGMLPLKGKAQYRLFLEVKEKGSEHPIINHLFCGEAINHYEKFCLEHWNSGGNFELGSREMDTLFYNENLDLIPSRDLIKGFSFDKSVNKYHSQIKINKKLYSLGRYTPPPRSL